jgi:hypothetical protein
VAFGMDSAITVIDGSRVPQAVRPAEFWPSADHRRRATVTAPPEVARGHQTESNSVFSLCFAPSLLDLVTGHGHRKRRSQAEPFSCR